MNVLLIIITVLVVLLAVKNDVCCESPLSSASSGDVLCLLSELQKQWPLRLQLLYDTQYEDIVSNISQVSVNISTGLMLYRNDGEKSTLSQMLTSAATGTTLLLIFCAVQNILHIFRMVKSANLESHRAKWLVIFSDQKTMSEVADGLAGVVHEGTQVTLARIELTNSTYYFSSSRIDSEGVVRFFEGENWHRSSKNVTKTTDKLQDLLHIMYPDHLDLYTDMQGRKLKIASNDIEGFFGLDWHSGNSTVPKLLGIDGSIINSFSQAFNFTYQTVRPSDGLWGNPLPNGTVTGLIGLTARREVAFAISAISVTWMREQVIDYTFPYFIEPSALFSRAPQEKNRFLASLSPFSLQVWAALAAATLFIGPLLSLQDTVCETLLKEESHVSLQDFSFNMFRTLTVQGNRLQTQRWSQRLIFFSWYLFCLIVSALYSGMLTAVLAIPEFETPIDYLTDLPRAVDNGFSVGILKGSAQQQLFKEAESGVFKQTWLLFDHKNPSESFVSRHDRGMYKVLERKFVFIGFRISSELMAFEMGRHKFHVGRENLLPMGIAMICPPGVPYKKLFDLMIKRIVEMGLLAKWRADEFTRVSFLASPQEETASRAYAISLTHLQAAFVVVVIGISVATITLIAENLLCPPSRMKVLQSYHDGESFSPHLFKNEM